jgi:protein gp37
MENIPIRSIKIGERHRKDMGNLAALAESIHEHGLLQPIGITKDHRLVFGERRLRACQDILQWDGIPAQIVDVQSIIEGEYAENELRKNFTPSERVAIAKEIEQRIGNRQGRRSDGELVENFPQVVAGAKTREIAAKSAGFGNDKTYRDAKKVAEEGTPELLAAMDSGAIPVSTAANLTNLPADEQVKVVGMPKASVAKMAGAAADQVRQTERAGGGKGYRGGPAPYVTQERWDAMLAPERQQILSPRDEDATTFNKQDNDQIGWAKHSWNPVTGCLHDCPYCYARDFATRFYEQKFKPTLHPGRLLAPRFTKVPERAATDIRFRNVFTGSMADLFGRWVPEEWIRAVLQAAGDAPQWNFLFLTKFPQRMAEFEIPGNCWMGTTVDCQVRVANAEKAFAKLRDAGYKGVSWLSIEPMLTPLKFTRLELFKFIVIGGASASTKTPAWYPPLPWVADLEAQAREAGCRIYRKSNLFAPIQEMPWDEPTPMPDQAPDVFHYLGGRKKGEAE